MASYGSYGNQPSAGSDNSSSFSPRERFWSAPGSATNPDSWGGQTYNPQLPELSSFSPNQHSPGNGQHPFVNNMVNIPSQSPYPTPPSTQNGGGSLPDMGFSGPSPPNPIHPIAVSSSPYPTPSSISPRRQYTPSTTPSPHITLQSPNNNGNGSVNSTGVNGNGLNGSSSRSSNESPPSSTGSNPNSNSTFESYLNGDRNANSANANGQVPNGLENGHGHMPGKNGPNDPTGHPNEVPGYLPHPRQSSHNSSRYPGDRKASDGEHMMHQYQHQQQQQHQNQYYQQQQQSYGAYGTGNNYPPYSNNMDPSYQQSPGMRRPFDPYQPYQNQNADGYGENFGPQHPHFRASTSTGSGGCSGRESGKVEELLENGQRKIDPSESLQILEGKPSGNTVGSSGTSNSAAARAPLQQHSSFDGGSPVTFDSTLMNLNSTRHSHAQQQQHAGNNPLGPSESPNNFDLNFPAHHHSQQTFRDMQMQQQQSNCRLYGSKDNESPYSTKSDESNNNTNSKPDGKRSKNNNNNNSQKNKNSSSSSSSSSTMFTFASCEDMQFETNSEAGKEHKETFLASGHPQSPPQANLGNPHPSPKSSAEPPRKKFCSDSGGGGGDGTPPLSEGGDRISPSGNSSPGMNPPLNSKHEPTTTTKKKKGKKNKQNLNAGDKTFGEGKGSKIKDESSSFNAKFSENSAVRVKEEPNDSFDSKHQSLLSDNFGMNNSGSSGGGGGGSVKMKMEADDDSSALLMGSSDCEDGDEDSFKKEKKEVPMVECGCFPADEVHAEPGPFYTHLGAAHNLQEMREMIESRTGFRGGQIRFEKVIYTGKEGKTSQGCPLAKWIIRRGSYEEQLLFLVKHRKGHKCATAWIVVCCVIWEGVPPHFADNLYDTLVYKLNRFGIPTTRRSDTNEQRSCACQGADPDTCGAAYSFGCAWSMFFNGCKYARSRNVRKFRLTEEHEEGELEEKVQHLATHLAPLYERVAPESYRNQVDHENEGLECRLGYRPGRPFSGVTVCLDYCSHAHKDAHNMTNGCTVTVSFTRNRTLTKGDDEQYHVLPLYKLDDTDEHGSKEAQKQKIKKGQLEILKKFPCKVRVRKVPLLPSRRRGKAKPPSSSSSGGGGGGSGSSSSLKSPPDYGDMSSLKREKIPSLFEDHLPNGTAVGNEPGLFDSRFHSPYSSHPHHPHHPFSTDCSSSNPPNPSSLWNHFGHGTTGLHGGAGGVPGQSQHGLPPSGPPPPVSPFRSYFDSPFSSNSGQTTPGGNAPPSSAGSSFGHPSSLTELSPNSSMSRHSSSNPNLNSISGSGNCNPSSISSSSGVGSGSNNLSPTPGSASSISGYSSMSPILPSFRHTFMTEAESMMSSMSGSCGGSPPESSSSPRSGGSHQMQGQHKGGSGGNHPASSTSGNASSTGGSIGAFGPSASLNDPSYFHHGQTPYSGSGGAQPPATGGLYHPHPHNPCLPSAMSMSSGQMGGVPFSTSSMLGANSMGSPWNNGAGAGNPAASSFGPPPPDHFAMNMNMNSMNPLNPWNHSGHGSYSSNYPSTPYGTSPVHHPYAHPPSASGLNMNMGSMGMPGPNFGHPMNPMNQYSPYQNSLQQQQFQTPMSNSWGPPPPPLGFTSNMNVGMGMHPHPHAPPPPSCFVAPPKPKVIPEVNESYSDNEDAFKDSHLGGVAIHLTHGAVVLQCAKHEMHATTALKSPNRMYPSRVCLVFYQHKSMNNRFHGWSEWEKKIEAKKLQEVKLINQGKMEASPRKMKQLIKEGYLTDNS